MLVRLANPAARSVVLALAFLLALALAFFSIRNALAAENAGLATAAGLQRATQLEPHNFENWYLLGHYWQYTLEDPDPSRAISAYRTALALNPQSSDTWLDLATLYESEDRLLEANDAYLQAKRAYPLSAEVSWRYGNFLLRQEKFPQAFGEIRRAAYVDPRRSAEAFSRCWRVNPDIHAILDDVVPPDRDGYLDIIRELASSNRLEPALVVWTRMASLHTRLELNSVIPLTEALLQHQEYDDASRVWREAVSLSDLPPTGDPAGSVIWDGGFESGVRGGGLAWSIGYLPRGTKANLDTSQKRSGRASLRLDFDGKRNVFFDAVCNNTIVRPQTPYLFSAWVHTQRLTTDEGIRFRLGWRENSSNASVKTSDVHGSEPWTQIQFLWTSPRDVQEVRICVLRDTSGKVDGQIQGTAWIDDVSLIPAPSVQPQP